MVAGGLVNTGYVLLIAENYFMHNVMLDFVYYCDPNWIGAIEALADTYLCSCVGS